MRIEDSNQFLMQSKGAEMSDKEDTCQCGCSRAMTWFSTLTGGHYKCAECGGAVELTIAKNESTQPTKCPNGCEGELIDEAFRVYPVLVTSPKLKMSFIYCKTCGWWRPCCHDGKVCA